MVAFLFTVIISYLITSLFGYVVHWALHQTWAGQFNQAHMTHHLTLYPPEDFSSNTYRNAGKDSSPKFFAIAALPLIVIPIILGFLGVLPIYLVLTILVVEGLVGLLSDRLHDYFHITNHWLTRIPGVRFIFAEWVRLHRQHHVDMGTNYGIFSFHWDRLFKTFKKA